MRCKIKCRWPQQPTSLEEAEERISELDDKIMEKEEAGKKRDKKIGDQGGEL